MGHHSRKLSNIKIFDTDYENYEISYSCWSPWFLHHVLHFDNMSINSRTTEMTEETQQKVRDIVEERLPHYNLDHGMHWTKQGDQAGCEYDWKFQKETTESTDLSLIHI